MVRDMRFKDPNRASGTILKRSRLLPQFFDSDNYGQPQEYSIYTIGIFRAQ